MNLQQIRHNIDRLDSRILTLLNERMEQVLLTRKLKPKIEDRVREQELLERIRENATGLIDADFTEKIYRQIIEKSKSLQERDFELIAFQGEHGAFGEMAARKWNGDLVAVPCNEFADVFDGVQSGVYDYGIVPVENTLGGIVGEVNELLINTELHVVGAVELPDVASWHHQAVDRLGAGLRAVAWAPDGTVEALELAEAPRLLAVQWHPELQIELGSPQRRLFEAIVRMAGGDR